MSSDNSDELILSQQQQQTLLSIARQSILHGLEHGKVMPLQLEKFSPQLHQQRATFVTLNINGQLRGCIGSLEAYQAVVVNVAHNAFSAAFNDPRFMPLEQNEYEQLDIHISILNPAEEMVFDSEQDLINQVRPGIDGLIMQQGQQRGTFLPSVWQQLPAAEQFIQHLKLKAGLPADFWSPQLKVWRYTTTSFS